MYTMLEYIFFTKTNRNHLVIDLAFVLLYFGNSQKHVYLNLSNLEIFGSKVATQINSDTTVALIHFNDNSGAKYL